ncbi:MAG: hypothetical protein ACYC1D_14385 [Acidimicrobiales bacterium]
MTRPNRQPRQRITVTLDVIDEPGNASITLGTLLDIVTQLEHDAVIAVLVRLDITALRGRCGQR